MKQFFTSFWRDFANVFATPEPAVRPPSLDILTADPFGIRHLDHNRSYIFPGTVLLSDEVRAGMEAITMAITASKITLGATHREIAPYRPNPAYEDMQLAPPDWNGNGARYATDVYPEKREHTMNTISITATRWLAAIACEFDDYVIIEACFADTEETLINAIYETYHAQYDDIETWSISVTPCRDAEQFHSKIILLPEVTEAAERERVYALFLQRLAARYPRVSWVEENSYDLPL